MQATKIECYFAGHFRARASRVSASSSRFGETHRYSIFNTFSSICVSNSVKSLLLLRAIFQLRRCHGNTSHSIRYGGTLACRSSAHVKARWIVLIRRIIPNV